MPTKLILHGGFNKINGPIQKDDSFFAEIMKDAPAEAKVLLVYFADEEIKVATRIEPDKEQFFKNSIGKELEFRVTTKNTFEEDIRWADVIYFRGGRTVKLMDTLGAYRDLDKKLLGKTLAGDSAGANALARIYITKSSKEVGRGIGILPFKILVHYEDGQPNLLEHVEPQLETVFLREYETKVFYL